MTQEEKQLLLKDLCARLPYHPHCIGKEDEEYFAQKPTTEEQKKKLFKPLNI